MKMDDAEYKNTLKLGRIIVEGAKSFVITQ
jgi:hypothetical protein